MMSCNEGDHPAGQHGPYMASWPVSALRGMMSSLTYSRAMREQRKGSRIVAIIITKPAKSQRESDIPGVSMLHNDTVELVES